MNVIIEWLVSNAETQCLVEFGKFTTSLRQKAPAYHFDLNDGTDAEIKATIHGELVKSMKYAFGLSPIPSRMFLPSGTTQPI
jgi:hypothetical protein